MNASGEHGGMGATVGVGKKSSTTKARIRITPQICRTRSQHVRGEEDAADEGVAVDDVDAVWSEEVLDGVIILNGWVCVLRVGVW